MSTISHRAEPAPHASRSLVKPKSPGIFAFIMAALHMSRRRQAARVLRQYEHLIARSAQRAPHELNQNSGAHE
jgi:hypothetical protein